MLRDWSVGKFARYAAPLKPESTQSGKSSPEEWLAALYSIGDEAVLSSLKSRKELRKTAGLVRFSSGSIDDRKVNIEDEWAVLDNEDSEDEQDSGELGMDVDDDDSDSEEDVDSEDDGEDEEGDEEDSEAEMDDEEEEDVEIPVTHMKKRKRGLNPPLQPPPLKRVAFASTQGKQASTFKTQKKDEAPSSILKKQEPRVTKKTARPVKVANLASSNKAKLTEGGSEAYDFSQFFK